MDAEEASSVVCQARGSVPTPEEGCLIFVYVAKRGGGQRPAPGLDNLLVGAVSGHSIDG